LRLGRCPGRKGNDRRDTEHVMVRKPEEWTDHPGVVGSNRLVQSQVIGSAVGQVNLSDPRIHRKSDRAVWNRARRRW
jgi:hypothetical protein